MGFGEITTGLSVCLIAFGLKGQTQQLLVCYFLVASVILFCRLNVLLGIEATRFGIKNASIDAIFLVPGLVIIFLYLVETGKPVCSWIWAVGSILMLISVFGSRSAVISTAVIITLVWIKRFNSRWLIIPVLAIFIALLAYKSDSTIGRTYIYKTTLHLISNKPLFGYGATPFEYEYNRLQARVIQDEFRANGEFKPIHYRTDYVSQPYNELLYRFYQVGFVGIAILLLVLFRLRRYFNIFPLTPYSIFILSILLASSFYCILRYPLFLFMVVYPAIINTKTSVCRIRIVNVILLASLIVLYVIELQKNISWAKANRELNINPQAAIADYKRLYLQLQFNPYFLEEYALAQYTYGTDSGETYRALLVAATISSNPSIHLALGEQFEEGRNFQAALKEYSFCAFHSPKRIFPKYKLMNLYSKMAFSDSARFWAKQLRITPSSGNNIMQVNEILMRSESVGRK